MLQRLRPGRPPPGWVRRRDRRAGHDERRHGPGSAGRAGRRPGAKPARSAVGSSSSRSTPTARSAVERRVPLPSRWLRGFLEVQAIQADLAPVGRARRSPRRGHSSGRSRSRRRRRPVWLVPSGRGLRLSHHDPGGGAPSVAGLVRLRLFERVIRHATALRRLRDRRRRQHRLAARRAGRPADDRPQSRGLARVLRRGPRRSIDSPPAPRRRASPRSAVRSAGSRG